MKKLLGLTMMIVLIVMCTFAASAESAEYTLWDKQPYLEDENTKIIDRVVYKLNEENGEKYYEVYDWFDTVEAADTVEEINILPEIDGIKVTKIKFYDKSHRTANIKANRYSGNHNYSVKKVTIPDTVTYIGAGFFSVLEAVEELVVPASVQTYSFTDMENLKKVTFLGDLEALGGFKDCTNLEKVNLCGTVEKISYGAFENCKSLKDFDIPETVTDIGGSAFYRSGITSVTIPSGVDFFNGIYDYIFAYCENLTEVTFVGENRGVLSVPDGAFRYCSSLKTVTFPEYCKTLLIDWKAFNGCTALENLTLPKDNVIMIIGEEAFIDCTSLKSVVFPKTCDVLEIGSWAFRRCASLESVTLPEESKDVTVSYKAFRGCKKLNTVNNSENITRIYGGAFRGCTSLKNFTVSDELILLGKNAFYGCKNLDTFIVKGKANAPKIYSNAFYNTKSTLKFTVKNNTVSKSWKTALSNSGLKNAKITVK